MIKIIFHLNVPLQDFNKVGQFKQKKFRCTGISLENINLVRLIKTQHGVFDCRNYLQIK